MAKNKTYFSEKERQELAKKGLALPDGSFPIRNKQDLKDAIKSYGLAKNPEKAKKWIIKRAKELNATDLLPETWKEVTKSLTYEGYDSLTKSFIFQSSKGEKIRKTAQQVIEQHPEVALMILKKAQSDLVSKVITVKHPKTGKLFQKTIKVRVDDKGRSDGAKYAEVIEKIDEEITQYKKRLKQKQAEKNEKEQLLKNPKLEPGAIKMHQRLLDKINNKVTQYKDKIDEKQAEKQAVVEYYQKEADEDTGEIK